MRARALDAPDTRRSSERNPIKLESQTEDCADESLRRDLGAAATSLQNDAGCTSGQRWNKPSTRGLIDESQAPESAQRQQTQAYCGGDLQPRHLDHHRLAGRILVG